MWKLMDYLGNPQDTVRVIHVAGTSGKTSTAYYMESLLRAGGKKTGLTISPHINKLNDRVQIGGKPLMKMHFAWHLLNFHH